MSFAQSRNPAKQKLTNGELVLCMGLRQARTGDIAMIAAACGFDAVYIDTAAARAGAADIRAPIGNRN
jgi:hypothetical protein